MSKRIVISMTMTIELQDDEQPDSAQVAHCPRCGWTRTYGGISSAKRGLRAHTALCKLPARPDVIDVQNPPRAPIMQFWDAMLNSAE